MVVGVPKETARRASAGSRWSPTSSSGSARKDVEVVVESGAGEAALIPDALFEEAGAKIGDPWGADVVVKVAAADGRGDRQALRDGTCSSASSRR